MSRSQIITERLQQALPLQHLEVINESYNHGGPGTETHYKLVIVSEAFAGKRPVARHQSVYQLFQDQMQAGLHALALHTYTPDEWAATGAAPDSPACRGGSRHG